MARRNMKRMMFIAGGITLLALALIVGAVVIKLPKTAATGTAPTSQASTNSPAQTTIQGTTKTDQPAKVVPQPTSAAKVAPQPTSAANVNTQGPVAPTATSNGQQKTTTNANQPVATMPAAAVGMFEQPLKQYGSSIQRMVAQGLNISNKQLAMQLQAGKHLKDIAQAQGVSNNQLQTLLATSIQSGFGPAVQIGQLSQAQVSSFVRQAQQNPVLLEQTLSVTPPQPSHW
jgi:hypothetical protein